MRTARTRSGPASDTFFDADTMMRELFKTQLWLVLLMACANCAQLKAQDRPVSVEVAITRTATKSAKSGKEAVPDDSNVAVWLIPLDRTVNPSTGANKAKPPRLVQRNKTFEPHVLIVPVGTVVEFPNQDPFFHNIFSLYDGKRFDLGLYESGSKRTVAFDRPGVSFLFCNIHAEMSAVIVVVETPYFGLSDSSGHVVIPNVPDGRYQINIWYERSLPEALSGLTRTVTISNSARNLGQIRVLENPNFTPAHKNKYGLDYVPPPNPDYDHP
jgi:plastocyanin